MPKIKIKSNPYEKQINYWEGIGDADWCQITYGDKYKSSNLIKDSYREDYFTNVMNEVFKVLVDEFGVCQNKLEVQFEGVSEEYDSACNEVNSKYSNDIKFLRGECFLKSVDDVLKFETDVANEIKKSIPENYIEEFESSITEILKNLKNESANKYQVAMDTKSPLEKLNNGVAKKVGDEIDWRQEGQRKIETNISDMERDKESSIKAYNDKITEFYNFVDEVKKKEVIDVEDFLKCFVEMVKELQKDKKSEDEIKRDKVKFLNKELSKRIRAFRDETNKELHKHIQSAGEWVETIVKNNKKSIICKIPGVEEFCDEILSNYEKFNDKSVASDQFLKIWNWVMRGGVFGIALRFLAWWLVPIIILLTEDWLLDYPDKSKIKEKLRKFNTKFSSEFSKWYDKNIQGNVEKYFADNQKEIEKYFSTELQKLENTKNELGGQIEQLNGYLEILDCCNKEINGLFQWENSK